MAKQFLPFINAGRRTELAAIEVKKRLGLGIYASVDPMEALPLAGARVLAQDEVALLPDWVRGVLFQNNGDFSAVSLGQSPSTGLELIILNDAHHPRRQKATLMEEIVHIVLEHPRTVLSQGADGSWGRSYDGGTEDEAFSVGAACIMPYKWLFNHVNRGGGVAEVSEMFGVSEEYVDYRIKRAGLYRTYSARRSAS